MGIDHAMAIYKGVSGLVIAEALAKYSQYKGDSLQGIDHGVA